jgi:predicted protein tyrosine phosphatase
VRKATRRIPSHDDDGGDEPPARRNVLFVCSKNQWRSPTAERVWRKHPSVSVRSAGTSPSARRVLGLADLAWADVVLVMEEQHRRRIAEAFPESEAEVVVLDIPDRYTFMDPELVTELEEAVGAALGLRPPGR